MTQTSVQRGIIYSSLALLWFRSVLSYFNILPEILYAPEMVMTATAITMAVAGMILLTLQNRIVKVIMALYLLWSGLGDGLSLLGSLSRHGAQVFTLGFPDVYLRGLMCLLYVAGGMALFRYRLPRRNPPGRTTDEQTAPQS